MAKPAPRDGNGHSTPKGDHDRIDLNVPKPTSGKLITVSIAGALLLAVLLAVGLLPRLHNNKQLAVDAAAALNAPVPVNVVTARRADTTMKVLLPATLRPWQEASLYSRSSGFLKTLHVDINDRVKPPEVMAEISTPEVDKQLNAAQATLALQVAAARKAQTDLDFATKTNDRYQSLKATSGVTQVELDQYEANYNSAVAVLNQAKAQIDVAKANVEQLTVLQSFEKIVAPFPGIVTGRAYDVGAFIIANPTTADIPPLFKLAKVDVIRAFIQVPQNYALTVKQHQKVTITAREVPEREFIGEVLGTTNYLDPAARSLLTEVRIENADMALLPGMFCQATFEVKRDKPPLVIPAPALVINNEGKQVAIVKDGKVHFTPVTLGVDFGNEIEIASGLKGDEQIIGNPGERTVEDAPVKVAR